MRHPALIAAALLLPALAAAQSVTDSSSLRGKSFIEFGFGAGGTSAVSSSSGQSFQSNATGLLNFTHFVGREIGVEITAEALSASASNDSRGQRATYVGPVLFGVSYAPATLALSTSLRPYVSAAGGVYQANIASNGFTGQTAISESVAGARMGAGVNWFASRHFTMQLQGEYHAVGHFDHESLLPRKPGGFAVNLGIGFGWGGV